MFEKDQFNLSHVGLPFSLIPQMDFTSNSKHLKTICYLSGMRLNTFPYSFHSSTHFSASQLCEALSSGRNSKSAVLRHPPTSPWKIRSAVVSKDNAFLGKMLLHENLCDVGCFRKGSLLVVCSLRADSQAWTPFPDSSATWGHVLLAGPLHCAGHASGLESPGLDLLLL